MTPYLNFLLFSISLLILCAVAYGNIFVIRFALDSIDDWQEHKQAKIEAIQQARLKE